VKYEDGDLLADSHNILNRWKNYYSHLLNVHNVSNVKQIEVHTTHLLNVHNASDVKQIEIHMAEPLVPGPSHLEVEIAIV
jgi:hypothetical protein